MTNIKSDNTRKTVLVTGASSGIGYELSKLFAKNDYNLVLVARDQLKLEQAAKEICLEFPVQIEIITKDLSIVTSPLEIFTELQNKNINIDILVNNAGLNVYGPFSETDLQKEIQMIHINLISLTQLTKLFLPDMLDRKYGKILNVGSTGSFVPGPLCAVYCATKAYVLSFSEALSEELKNTNVTITALCPGATKTNFAKRAGMEHIKLFTQDVMEADKVAEIGYNSLMNGETIAIAGLKNKLTVNLLKFIPRKIVRMMSKDLMS